MKDKKALSPRTLQIRDFIVKFHDENGYPPTMREIAQGLNIKSTKTVFDHVYKLESMGLLVKNDRNRARSLVPAERTSTIKIPLVGKITAGTPITAIENIEDIICINSDFFKGGDLFVLKVSGDSMKDAGILDKDLIVVRKQPTANNGEIIVALLNGESTVKRFFKEHGYVRLCPENDGYAPILTDNVEILGLVVGVVRNIII